MQADPSVCATWDTLVLEGYRGEGGDNVASLVHALHQAWSHATLHTHKAALDDTEIVA